MKRSIIIVLILLGLGIGGFYLWNTAQQKARQELLLKIEMERIRQENITKLKDAIAGTKAELQMANEKLSSISEFQFLRTADEKEAQLKEQYAKIEKLQSKLSNLESQLSIQ